MNALLGHKKQIKYLLNCIQNNQLPNAWLFYGLKGVGKATLASNIAKVLSNIDARNADSLEKISEDDLRNPKLQANLTNVFQCTRQWDDKKKKFSKGISIDDVRQLQKKFLLKSSDNSYKICIVDSTEDLNLSAANSLLKILEEPPSNSLFILISNNVRSVIPTIFSRCHKVGFHELNKHELSELASNFFHINQINTLDQNDILSSSQGSAKKLFNLLDKEYLIFFNKMKALLSDIPKIDRRKFFNLVSQHREYFTADDPDKSAIGIILKLLSFLVRCQTMESDNFWLTKLNIKSGNNYQLVAAHLYSQISLLRHQTIQYNIENKKVVFFALNLIQTSFANLKNE